MELIDYSRQTHQENPEWLYENTVSKVFKFLTALKKKLEQANYDVAFVGKTRGEAQYTPPDFKSQRVDGHHITGVSHDALWVDGKQYDFVAAASDEDHAIFDPQGNRIRATPVANPIPQEYWRPSNPPIKSYAVANVEQKAPQAQLKDRDTFYRELTELNDFYESFDGLQRPGGMVIHGRADVQALGAWGYDLMTGKTVDECKNAIRNSFEWRAKH